MPDGCTALRDPGDADCEVERIFVKGVFRSQRIGRALLERRLFEARAAGYCRIRFDAHVDEEDAQRLCERVGFIGSVRALGELTRCHTRSSIVRDL